MTTENKKKLILSSSTVLLPSLAVLLPPSAVRTSAPSLTTLLCSFGPATTTPKIGAIITRDRTYLTP